jgi:hypothetical protein
MDPSGVEKMTALALLLIGLAMVSMGLTLSGIVQVPLFGMIILIAGLVSLFTAVVLYKDSGSPQQ